jgi:chromosome partitioning protein
MITYTVYSEGGGVGKTTIAANLAHAHANLGDDVLVIDLDQQYGSLSRLVGLDDNRKDSEADDLSLHIIDRPKGPFQDLIRETDAGFDVIPSHNRIGSLSDFLDTMEETEQNIRQDDDYEFPRYEQLLDVLLENEVQSDYDVLIIDPNAKADDNFYSAIYATQNIVMPVEPSGKGAASVEGLKDEVNGLSEALGIDVGVLAAVPNDINEQATDDSYYVEQLQETSYDVPVTFGHRRSLFRGCWRDQCTAFEYVNEVRDRKREREVQTLEKFTTLAEHVKQVTEGDKSTSNDSASAQDDGEGAEVM